MFIPPKMKRCQPHITKHLDSPAKASDEGVAHALW